MDTVMTRYKPMYYKEYIHIPTSHVPKAQYFLACCYVFLYHHHIIASIYLLKYAIILNLKCIYTKLIYTHLWKDLRK